MIRYNTKRMEKDRIRRNQIDFIYKRNTRRYVTRDGGTTFTELQLPLETVTELPPLAKELNFTIENYKYCEMPKKKEDILTIKLLTGAGEIQGIRFESKDNGETWAYAGISVE